jgi:drug/metabolite transporter (DMT)-like permease
MPDRLLGYILLCLAMATVGTTVIASKVIAGLVPPFVATAMRFAIALPVLAGLMLLRRERLPRLTLRGWGLLLLQAGAGSVGYTVLLIAGLGFVSASDAGVVIGTLPAVSALFAVLVLGERPGGRLALAVGAATAGVMLVAWHGSGPGSALGIALILGAVACESAFILLQKRLATPLPPLTQATAMTGLGLLLTLPFALADLPGLTLAPGALAAITWYALVPTVAGFLLWYAGAARVQGAEAAVCTAVAPVTAVLLAALVLGEALSMAQIVGLAAVAGAIVILALPRQRGATP